MSNVPHGFVAIPFIDPAMAKEPTFGQVTGKETMTLVLYVDKARQMQDAAGLVPYTLGQAANVFGLIWRLTGSGFGMNESELCSLAELCQRGLDAVADKEGEAISQMDSILRSALSFHAKKQAGEAGQ